MLHELKTWKEYFDPMWIGQKLFEARKNDRDFKVGDDLLLIETDLGGAGMTDYDLSHHPTGRTILAHVQYILPGGQFGIAKDHCVMSIDILEKNPFTPTNNQSINNKQLYKIWKIKYQNQFSTTVM